MPKNKTKQNKKRQASKPLPTADKSNLINSHEQNIILEDITKKNDSEPKLSLESNTEIQEKSFCSSDISQDNIILCKHIRKIRPNNDGRSKKHKIPIINSFQCVNCKNEGKSSDSEDLWLCLSCLSVKCGRYSNQHSLNHSNIGHNIVLNMTSLFIWCYKCDEFVEESQLDEQIKSYVDSLKSVIESKRNNKNIMKSNKSIGDPIIGGCQIKSCPIMGLNNMGNTCFFNSALQNLIYLAPLRESIQKALTDDHYTLYPKRHPNLEPLTLNYADNDEPGKMTTEFSNLINLVKLNSEEFSYNSKKNQRSNKSISPSGVHHTLTDKYKRFRGGRQHDSHEALRFVLDMMKEEEIRRMKRALILHFDITKKSKEEFSKDYISKVKMYASEFKNAFIFHDTFIDNVFGGQLISTLSCLECNSIFNTTEHYLDLSIPLLEQTSRKQASLFKYDKKHEKKRQQKESKKQKLSREISQNDATTENSHQPIQTLRIINKDNLPQNEIVIENNKSIDPEIKRNEENDKLLKFNLSDNNELVPLTKMNKNEKIPCITPETITDNVKTQDEGKDPMIVENNTPIAIDVNLISNSIETLSLGTDKFLNQKEYDRLRKEEAVPMKDTILACLTQFFSPDLIKGDYICSHCNKDKMPAQDTNNDDVNSLEKSDSENENECDPEPVTEELIDFLRTNASKQFLLNTLPLVLTIQLKRFAQTNMRLRKVDKHIEFPLILDMSPFCMKDAKVKTSQDNKILYGLRGIVEHLGSLIAGHYVAYINASNWAPSPPSSPIVESTTNMDIAEIQNNVAMAINVTGEILQDKTNIPHDDNRQLNIQEELQDGINTIDYGISNGSNAVELSEYVFITSHNENIIQIPPDYTNLANNINNIENIDFNGANNANLNFSEARHSLRPFNQENIKKYVSLENIIGNATANTIGEFSLVENQLILNQDTCISPYYDKDIDIINAKECCQTLQENTQKAASIKLEDNLDAPLKSTPQHLMHKLPEVPGEWYYISDSSVRKVKEEEVLKVQAYMLFYERLPLTPSL